LGQPLNRIARLLSAGHGGQGLGLAAPPGLGRGTPPPSVRFKPLGGHPPPGPGRPGNPFQPCPPDLPSRFPPLRSLGDPPTPTHPPKGGASFRGGEKEERENHAPPKKHAPPPPPRPGGGRKHPPLSASGRRCVGRLSWWRMAGRTGPTCRRRPGSADPRPRTGC